MLISDGYSIEQYSNQNKVVINLPQILETATTTTGMICDRKKELNQTELMTILLVTKMCFANK